MKKTLEYVQSHFRGLTRRNRFGGRWEWGPEVIQRLTDPLAHPILEGSRYDYRNQAWLVNGVYQDCGHPEAVDCQCFGRIHEGEVCDPANHDIH